MRDEKENVAWPITKFSFIVNWGTIEEMPFLEVSGLDIQEQVIEYRQGNSKTGSTIKMPGIVKVGNVILKKGVFLKIPVFLNGIPR